jgi:hypothetical protein
MILGDKPLISEVVLSHLLSNLSRVAARKVCAFSSSIAKMALASLDY